MTLDLLKRAEKGAALTATDHDANFTAIETQVNANEAALAGKAGLAFSTVTVGATNIVADSSADTLTLIAGANVTLTPSAGADSVTFDVSSLADVVVEQALVNISINTTLTAAAHQGRTLFCTAAVNLTVDSATDFAAGKGCNIIAEGGIVTIVATATVNRVAGKPLTIPRYDAASLLRTSITDVYLLFGGMA